MKQSAVIIFLVMLLIPFFPSNLSAQDASQIYLVKMTLKGDAVEFGKPVKITSRDGYNNQPYFGPDGTFLLYSSATGKQTDIYRYHIQSRKTVQLTDTPQSEYSPTPMIDGKRFSVIQQINTQGPDKGAQKLMAFPLNPKGPLDKIKPELLFYKKEKKVGYHAWLDQHTVAMFVLGKPHTLQIADLKKSTEKTAAGNIGRSIYKAPGNNAISFTHYIKNERGVIKTVDMEPLKLTSIIEMQKGAEYYAWTPGKSLLTAAGSKVYKYQPGKDYRWQEIADFRASGITKITRLAVSPKAGWLAVVSNKK